MAWTSQSRAVGNKGSLLLFGDIHPAKHQVSALPLVSRRLATCAKIIPGLPTGLLDF